MEEQRRAQIQIHKRREGKWRERLRIQIPLHLPRRRRSRVVVSISRCMDVTRAREKRAGRKGVAPLTESCHRRALLRRHGGRVGRSGEGGRKKREERLAHGRKCGRMVRAVEVAARCERKVEMKKMSG